MNILTPSLPLLCQPVTSDAPQPAVYKKYFREQGFTISLRPLCLSADLDLIYQWVHLPYAKRFWKMDVSKEILEETYQHILSCGHAGSFLCHLEDVPVCQIEVYHAQEDEISLCYNALPGDYGIHVLMAPRQTTIPGLSVAVFRTCLEYIFSFPEVRRVVGEPDVANERANLLVKKVGFIFQHIIRMSYKKANLYYCTRSSFNHQQQV
jgi:hypothetical protein